MAIFQSIMLSLILGLISACDGPFGEDREVIDLSHHFWSYVDGTYQSSQNGYFLQFNASQRKVTWHQPLEVDGSEKGEVCYLSVEAKVDSISTVEPGWFSDNNPESLRAKGEVIEWTVKYVRTPSNSEIQNCENIRRANSYIQVNPIVVPIHGYGEGVIELGQPMVCFFSCEPAKSLSTQDFSSGSPGVYNRATLPWETN